MTDAANYQFTNLSGPKAYDEFFVPRLFQPWAKLLLDEVNLRPGEAVLDVATGPGTVARLAAVKLGSQGRVVDIDIVTREGNSLVVTRHFSTKTGLPPDAMRPCVRGWNAT